MSRDFRPIEAVAYDAQIYKEKGEYLHDARFTMVVGDKEEPAYNDEARKAFPNLCYLLSGFEVSTYERIKDDDAAFLVWSRIEKSIGRMADSIHDQILAGKTKLTLDDLDVPDKIKSWFTGELDECFYYNTQNNVLFREWVMDEIAAVRKQEIEAQKTETEEVYKENEEDREL